MRNSAVTIFIPWQRIRQYQMWEAQKKTHFSPKAAPALCQDLITASHKTSSGEANHPRSPFWVPFSCLSAQQGLGSPAQRGLQSSHPWEEVDVEDKQTLPLLLHSCSIQWSQQPLTDSVFKSSSIIAFFLLNICLVLYKSEKQDMCSAKTPKSHRENTSRKGQQQWGWNALLWFEPGFSLFHVPGKKAALP